MSLGRPRHLPGASSILDDQHTIGQRPCTRPGEVEISSLKTGGLFERLLKDLVSIDRAPVWLRDWIVFEREATLLRWFQPLLVPGLLQTEDYARAVLEWGGLLDTAEVERSVVSRMERQEILHKAKPPHFVAIIDEAVLRRFVGSAEIMTAQCQHLVACAQRPNINLHVLPASAGAHAGLAGAFILAKGTSFEVAHVDNNLRAVVIEQRDQLDTLGRKWEALRGEALPRSQSTGIIKEAAESWTP